MFRQPVLVFAGKQGDPGERRMRPAVSRGVALSVFTADLFATGNDRDNRAAVRAVGRADLDLAGLAVTARATPSTRSSRARACTRRRSTVLYYM